jgi:single-strand DNA-binding protein
MPNFSQLTIIGHLGKTAEVRQTTAGPVVSFSVAFTRKRKDKESTTWCRCDWFGTRAEKVAQYLEKGKAVLVTGELYEDTYEKDGQERKSLKVDVRDVTLLGGKQDGERAAPAQRAAAPSRDAGDDFDSTPF